MPPLRRMQCITLNTETFMMLLHKLAVVVCTTALVGAVGASTAAAQGATDSTGGKMSGMKGGSYVATLTSPSGGTVAGMGKVDGTTASVMISGDKSGSVRPWHIHIGSCGNDKGIFGSPSAYKPITVGSDGKGKSTATLSMPLPDSGSYFFNVHSSSSDMKTIVACGPLTKGM
jgi:hypothetical protein